jgi:pyrimidine oxygenase
MMRALDLGIFLPNAKAAPSCRPRRRRNTSRPGNSTRRIADRRAAGFDFLLSMVKWRGFGGVTNHWDYSLESFSLMSAVAAVTSRIQLYASVAIPPCTRRSSPR